MQLLDRYRPLYVIGRGGMGTIEVAIDTGSRGVVALKRMLPNVRDRKHADMFMREARLATLLNHANVVHAFAFGEQDGELLFAMEYVAGETLASLQSELAAKDRRVPLDVAMFVLAELCDGLHAAHELRDVTGAPLGVVHRDVCPHNAMLSYVGEVKLLDFGVAKLGSAHLTKTGEVKGKTAYMSPEQAMGEALDRRSDLYGVGAMLFELVTGRRMWSGDTDLELLRQLALGEAPELADAAKDAPAAVCELHARLVSKNAAGRPDTAADVASALRACMSTSEEEARAALVALLADTYGDAAREKKRALESALDEADRLGAQDDPRSGEPGAVIAPPLPPRRDASRAAPWLYALLGAAIASAAVLVARRETPTPAASAASAAPSAIASVAASVEQAAQTTTATNAPSAATERAIAPSPRAVPRTRVSAPASAHPSSPPAATAAPRARPEIDVDPHAI